MKLYPALHVQLSKMFCCSSKAASLVTCLHILSILVWLSSTTGAPTTVVAAVARLPQDTSKENEFQFTTTHGKGLIEQVDCVLTPDGLNLLKTEAIATIALFYMNHSNFVFIAIDPYDAKYFGNLISYTSKELEFNHTKLYELYQIDEDHAGLVEVLKVNDKITLNLEGQSPGSKECIFKVSRYLCTQDDVPVADYLLFESMKYPGHYIRRYDDKTIVDCEPEQPTVPIDTAHFYWRASKIVSSDSGNDHVQLLSSHNDDVLTFSNNTALMYSHHS